MALKTLRFFNERQHTVRLFSHYKSEIRGRDLTPRSWKVMFFGTDDFSLGSLAMLNAEMKSRKSVAKLEVVTSKFHSNPVRIFGKEEGLIVHEWPIEPEVTVDFDIGLVASFGHLIPKKIINAFPLGMLNVHASLLPRWRGAAPINYAIMYGDEITGISIMRIQPHTFDKGEVLQAREVAIFPTESSFELRARLSKIGGEELISCVQRLPSCLENARPQAKEGVSYAPKLSPELGIINFEKMTAWNIFNRFRALYGIVPLVTTWMGMTICLHEVNFEMNPNCPTSGLARIINEKSDQTTCLIPGKILFDKKRKYLIVHCCENSHLIVNRIAPRGKRKISALEFYNGYLRKQDRIHWFFK